MARTRAWWVASLTVSKETLVLIDCFVKIMDIVLLLKGWKDRSPSKIFFFTACARCSTSLTSSPDQSSMWRKCLCPRLGPSMSTPVGTEFARNRALRRERNVPPDPLVFGGANPLESSISTRHSLLRKLILCEAKRDLLPRAFCWLACWWVGGCQQQWERERDSEKEKREEKEMRCWGKIKT